eukprot:2753169-Pleurochrysis_carterae.AAC.1
MHLFTAALLKQVRVVQHALGNVNAIPGHNQLQKTGLLASSFEGRGHLINPVPVTRIHCLRSPVGLVDVEPLGVVLRLEHLGDGQGAFEVKRSGFHPCVVRVASVVYIPTVHDAVVRIRQKSAELEVCCTQDTPYRCRHRFADFQEVARKLPLD